MSHVTRILLCTSLLLTTLVQTQRLAPSSLALPDNLEALFAEPWRAVSPFCYSDGLTIGYLLRLHVFACTSYGVEYVCSRSYTAPASRVVGSPLRLKNSLLYAACVVIAGITLTASTALRPSELAVPFLLGPASLLLCYMYCSLPAPYLKVVGGVGVPAVKWLPYAVILSSGFFIGAAASLHFMGAVGAGVLIECFDLLPLPAATKVTTSAGRPAALHSGRRTGCTVCLICMLLATNIFGPLDNIPLLPRANLMAKHGRALVSATTDADHIPGTEAQTLQTLLGNLAASTNLTMPSVSDQKSGRTRKPLGASQVLDLYQIVADTWAAKLQNIRSPPSLGNLRAKGGGPGAESEVTEEQAAEMERLLSDALTRADFASTTSDRDVLKALMRTLTPTQAATMAKMPRERVLSTVAAHRDSHRVAHEALARLGKVLEEFSEQPVEAKNVSDNSSQAVQSHEAAEGADLLADVAPLGARLLEGLNETLSLFAVPLEMTDDEVVHELLAGTSTERKVSSGHKLRLKELTHSTRESILERFINSSVSDLRGLLSSEGTAAVIESVDQHSPTPRGKLNTSEHADALDLAVDLLMHHEIEPTNADDKNQQDLFELLNLEPDEAIAGTSESLSANAARPGCAALLLEAAVEWRRQKRVKDAANEARKLLMDEQETELDVQIAGAQQATNAVAAGPPTNLSDLVATGLSGYDVPATMSDQEVVVEYLQLLSLEQSSLTAATSFWLQSAIVSYRRQLANSAAAANESLTTKLTETSASPESLRKNASVQIILTQMNTSLPAHVLLDGNGSYPLFRARSTTLASEDFAVAMAAVLQAFRVHARVTLICAPSPVGANGEGAGSSDFEPAKGGCRLARSLVADDECKSKLSEAGSRHRAPGKCRTVIEVRLGRSPKKLAAWVAQHRKRMRSAHPKSQIKGAKTLHYTKDSDGYVWLPLTYHAAAGAEQVPGAAYPANVTHGSTTLHFPLPFTSPGADHAPVWSLHGYGMDSQGHRLPSGSSSVTGSVLSTL